MLIHKKILAVMHDIKAIAKTQKSVGGSNSDTNTADAKKESFAFRGVEEVYNALQPLFQTHGIFCTTEILSHSTNGLGKTLVEAKFSFFCEDGSSVCSTTRGEVIDRTDKGTTSALSIAHRIALTQMFLIPTDSDMPWLTPHLFAKSRERISKGDFQLYFKLEKQYKISEDQKLELQKLIVPSIQHA